MNKKSFQHYARLYRGKNVKAVLYGGKTIFGKLYTDKNGVWVAGIDGNDYEIQAPDVCAIIKF